MSGKEQENAFTTVKQLITSAPVLVDSIQRNHCLSVLMHHHIRSVQFWHIEKPTVENIAFVSRSLSHAENYSQMDKEALAFIFGVEKFHQYLSLLIRIANH